MILSIYLLGALLSYLRVTAMVQKEVDFDNEDKSLLAGFIVLVTISSWVGFIMGVARYVTAACFGYPRKFFALKPY